MLFTELYKIMVNKLTFVGFRGLIAPIAPPLDPPCNLVHPLKKYERPGRLISYVS